MSYGEESFRITKSELLKIIEDKKIFQCVHCDHLWLDSTVFVQCNRCGEIRCQYGRCEDCHCITNGGGCDGKTGIKENFDGAVYWFSDEKIKSIFFPRS